MCKWIKMYRTLGIVIFLCALWNATTELVAQNDVLAHQLADQADALDNRASLPFLAEAFELCKYGACHDSTIARLYQLKSVAYYLDYIDDYAAVRLADTCSIYFKKAFGNNNLKVANAKFNLGAMLRTIGDYYNSLLNIDTALSTVTLISINEARNLDSIKLNYLIESCYVARIIGDHRKALVNGEKAMSIISSDSSRINDLKGLLALAYKRIGKLERAKEIYEIGIINSSDPPLFFYADLGLIYLELNELSNAEALFQLALDKANGNTTQKLDLFFFFNQYANLAELYIRKKQLEEAMEYIDQGINLLQEYDTTGQHTSYAEFFLLYSKIKYNEKNYIQGLSWLSRALNVVTPNLAEVKEDETVAIIGDLRFVIDVLNWRIKNYLALQQYPQALEDIALVRRLVTQSKRAYQSSFSKYFLEAKVKPIYEQGIYINRLLYEQTGEAHYLTDAYNMSVGSKALLLLESIQSERAMQFADLPPEVLAEEGELRRALLNQEKILYSAHQQGGETDSLEAVVLEHEQRYDRFIKALERDYPRYYQIKHGANAPVALPDVQAKLASDQALLEYFIGQDSIYSFLVDKGQLRLYSQLKPQGFVDTIALYRELVANSIDDDCEQDYIRLSRYLYDLLLGQPLADLKEAYTRLLIVPDGLLNFVSFESLLYKDIPELKGSDGFVLERYATSYAYSSRLLLEDHPTRSEAAQPFGGFGMEYDDHTLEYLSNIDYLKSAEKDSTWQIPCGPPDTTRYLGRLAYSDDEVRDIAAITGGDQWLNEQVTKDRFLENAKDYRLLHMAMHGTYDLEFPMNSSLIFTRKDSNDIFLRASEIYGLELASDMVVLSACNTAYGTFQRGEGPMTLARAFHYAGIPAVVASLWSIPDNSTSRIMTLFYAYLDKGLAKDEALREAKLAYLGDNKLSSPATRQPAHWASAMVIGEVAPVVSDWSWWWMLAGVGLLGVLLPGFMRRNN